MKERIYALFGIIGPLVGYIFTGVSIVLSPWFSWQTSALSDLGHAVKSEVAPIFNLGLLLAGFLLTVYAVAVFRKHVKYTSILLVVSSLSLQLIAVFDEVYGFLHFAVSVLFFLSLGLASIIYAFEKKSYMVTAAFIIGLLSWLLYWARIFSAGVAVPETISSGVAVVWVFHSAIRICLSR